MRQAKPTLHGAPNWIDRLGGLDSMHAYRVGSGVKGLLRCLRKRQSGSNVAKYCWWQQIPKSQIGGTSIGSIEMIWIFDRWQQITTTWLHFSVKIIFFKLFLFYFFCMYLNLINCSCFTIWDGAEVGRSDYIAEELISLDFYDSQ